MNVSAIVPVYNGEGFLEESLHSLLAQTVPLSEIVVIDDGSTDGTAVLLRSIADRYPAVRPAFLQKNHGVSYARNYGVQQARGEWCLFWDADDLADPGMLAKYRDSLDHCAAAGMAVDLFFCASVQIDENNRPISGEDRFIEIDPSEYFGYLMVRNPIKVPGVMIRRQVFEALGGFDLKLKYSEDWDLWLRVAESYAIRYVDEVLCRIRRHSGNASARLQNMLDGEKQVLTKYEPETIKQAIFRRKLPADRNRIDYAAVSYRLGRWEEGFRMLEQIVEPSVSLFFYRGLYYVRKEEYGKAAELFQSAVHLNPEHFAALNNLACCHWLTGKKKEAITLLKKIVGRNPAYMDAAGNLQALEFAGMTVDQSQLRFTWRELRKVLTVYQET